MSDEMTAQSLRAAEGRLQKAVFDSDVEVLDELLHDTVHYVGPDGTDLDKRADLEQHRSGALRISESRLLRLESSLHPGLIGETRATIALAGRSHDTPFAGTLVYNRTWLLEDGRWQVIAATGEIASPPAQSEGRE